MSNNLDSKSWFTFYQPNPKARLSLFCFPHAGGGASSYSMWTNELPSDVEIIGIQMPGVENRLMEPPISSISSIVEILIGVIKPKLNKPAAFFGHSLGAIVSFELTRKLRRQYGYEPIHLFVSGMSAPQISDLNPPIHQLTEDVFLKELHHRYRGISLDILQYPDIIKELLPGLRAGFEMYESYCYIDDKPLDCPITVFGGLEDSTARQEDLGAWCKQTKKAFTLHMIPGNHFFIHFERQRFLRVLSNELNKTLVGLK